MDGTPPAIAAPQEQAAAQPDGQAAAQPDGQAAAQPDGQAAAQPERGYEIELAGQVSYLSTPIRGGTNPFGAGFGGHIGLAFAGGLYLGASALDFLGGKDVDLAYRAILYGVDLGWAFPFHVFGGALFALRPQLGIGDAAIYFTDPSQVDVVTSASGSSSSDTTVVNNVYLRPGLSAMLSSGGHFVGIDGSMLVVPGITYGGTEPTTWLSYGAQAQLGFRF